MIHLNYELVNSISWGNLLLQVTKSSKIVRILLTLKGNGDIVLLVLDITSQKTSRRFCFFDKKESSKREKNT
jgi:hypothetical protein